MPKSRNNKKGVILFIVLGTLLVVTLLASVVLRFTASHYRLTHHEISRIQAYYAAMAGMNLAFEKLRAGTWDTGSYTLCSSSDCTVKDNDIPYPVTINISSPDANGMRSVNLTSTYTYTP